MPITPSRFMMVYQLKTAAGCDGQMHYVNMFAGMTVLLQNLTCLTLPRINNEQ